MTVDTISFSAHADFLNTRSYIDRVLPPNIVLVHGDSQQMKKLKGDLDLSYKQKIQIMMPRNCQLVRMKLLGKKNAKLLGALAKSVVLKQQALDSQSILEGPRMKQLENGGDEKDVEMANEDEIDFKQVDIAGVFIKHDFDQIVVAEDEEEVERFTAGDLLCSQMRQQLSVPFEHDIQVLVYFLYAHYPHVETQQG
jgi:hypothetical protein